MKITSINNFKNNISNIQNFNGLWGKTSQTSDMDAALGIVKVQTTSYYYPYKDENQKAAEVLVQGCKNAYIDESSSSQPRYIVNDCRLCATLPFTEAQYKDYQLIKKGTRLNDLFRDIHKIVPRFYENPEHGSQISAKNYEI